MKLYEYASEDEVRSPAQSRHYQVYLKPVMRSRDEASVYCRCVLLITPNLSKLIAGTKPMEPLRF